VFSTIATQKAHCKSANYPPYSVAGG